MKIKLIKHNSKDYWELVALRDNILRKPLGLHFTKEELLAENNQHHYAFFENDIIIAGLILVESDNDFIKMRQVCVSESKQGKGIGNKLVLYAENWARMKGFKTMFCHARENALEFYTKLEYKKEGDTFLEVGLEHFKLIKKL